MPLGLSTRVLAAPIGVTFQNRTGRMPVKFMPLSQYFLQRDEEPKPGEKRLYGRPEPAEAPTPKKTGKRKRGVREPEERQERLRWSMPALPGEPLELMERKRGQFKILKPQKCKFCEEPASKAVVHSNAYAYVPVCDSHLGRAKRAVGSEFCYTQPIMQPGAQCELCNRPASFVVYKSSGTGMAGGMVRGACKKHLEQVRELVNKSSRTSNYGAPVAKRLARTEELEGCCNPIATTLDEARGVKEPVVGGWRILGIDDEVDTCEQCGKTGLKRTVVLEPTLDGGGIKRVGTTCAEYLTKNRGSWVMKRGVQVQREKDQAVDKEARSKTIQGVVKAGQSWKLLQRLFGRYLPRFIKGDFELTPGQVNGIRANLGDIIKKSGLTPAEVKKYHGERFNRAELKALDKFYEIATGSKVEERAARCGSVAASMGRTKPTEVQKRRRRYEKEKTVEGRTPRTFRDIAMSASKKRKKRKAELEAAGKVEVPENPGVFIDGDAGIWELIRLVDRQEEQASGTCSYCDKPATKEVVWADGKGRVKVCSAHVTMAQKKVAKQGGRGKVEDTTTANVPTTAVPLGGVLEPTGGPGSPRVVVPMRKRKRKRKDKAELSQGIGHLLRRLF